MSASRALERLGAVCKRYGPGRLPRADRRAVGAGYAGAAAALLVAAAFALGMVALDRLGPTVDTWVIDQFWGLSALVAAPIVGPSAFVAGAVVWRSLPETLPYFGAVAGLLATLLTYVVSLGLVFLAHAGVRLTAGSSDPSSVLVEAGAVTALVGVFAVALTGWLTLPVGCASGAIYERARTVGRD